MLQVWDWVLAHQLILGGFVSAALDLVFALVPSWESNGVLHWIYLQVKKLTSSAPPPAAP